MIEEEYKEIARNFINEIVDYGFIEQLKAQHRLWQLKEWKKSLDIDFTLTGGCFKLVFILPNFRYVIKTDCIDEWVEGTERKYAGCRKEYEHYLKACEDGMEDYFPITDFLLDIGGYKFYIQERAEVDSDAVGESIFNSVRREFDNDEDAWNYVEDEVSDEDVIMGIFDNYKLYEWLMDNNIDDIHGTNLGVIGDDWKIIDFAGAFEEEEEY